MICHLILQGDSFDRTPGLGLSWFCCCIILSSYPTTSAKLQFSQTESGRLWSGLTKIRQSNPGAWPPDHPVTPPSLTRYIFSSVSPWVPEGGLRLLPDRPRGAALGLWRRRRPAGRHGVPAEGGQALPGQEEEEEDLRQLFIFHEG